MLVSSHMSDSKEPSSESRVPSVEATSQPEKVLTDEERRLAKEVACRELFIAKEIFASELTPEQKVLVAEFVQRMPGQWREYDGKDVRVFERFTEGEDRIVVFQIFMDEYPVNEVEEKIPLTKDGVIKLLTERIERNERVIQESDPREGAIEAAEKAIAKLKEHVEHFEQM